MSPEQSTYGPPLFPYNTQSDGGVVHAIDAVARAGGNMDTPLFDESAFTANETLVTPLVYC